MNKLLLLIIFLLVSCQAREYQLLNHQVVGVEGEQGGIMGACAGITNTGPRGPMLLIQLEIEWMILILSAPKER